MTFQSLEYFLVVYEEGSITVAAKRLFISQQSLSAQIQRLEEACGTELFVRRPVFKPTFAGEKLAKTAREILRLKKEVLTELEEIEDGQKGKMTFGYSGILVQEHLPELLRRFYERYPDVEVTATTSDSLGLEELAMDGRVDFYIGTSAGKIAEMTIIPLIEFGLVVAIRKSVLKKYTGLLEQQAERARTEGLSLGDLQKIPLILPMKGWRMREPIDYYIKHHRLSVKVALEASQFIAVSACEKGIGAAILYSTIHIADRVGEDRILRFPLKDMDYAINWCICYRRDHFLTACEEEFIRLTREYFEEPFRPQRL